MYALAHGFHVSTAAKKTERESAMADLLAVLGKVTKHGSATASTASGCPPSHPWFVVPHNTTRGFIRFKKHKPLKRFNYLMRFKQPNQGGGNPKTPLFFRFFGSGDEHEKQLFFMNQMWQTAIGIGKPTD